MSKLQDAIDFLRTDEGSQMSQPEAAKHIGCSRANVRRALAVIEADRRSSQFSDDPSEAGRLLADVIAAAEAKDSIAATIADLKSEMKDLKDQLKEMETRERAAIHTARETHPLFDQKNNGKPSLAAVG